MLNRSNIPVNAFVFRNLVIFALIPGSLGSAVGKFKPSQIDKDRDLKIDFAEKYFKILAIRYKKKKNRIFFRQFRSLTSHCEIPKGAVETKR